MAVAVELSTKTSIEPTTKIEPSTKLSTKPLLGSTLEELTQWVEEQGQPKYRGKQLYQWLYQQGGRSLADISVFPKKWRAELADVPVGRSQLYQKSKASDGTAKYLLQMKDGQVIETVGIPTEKRLTVCVSSQVGCAMACDFCATGKGGFMRNLERHEIIDQVLTVQEGFKQRVSNIVFMGMGEPLLNMSNVLAAVRSLNKDIGIGQRFITISTVGIPNQIRRLAQHKLQATLAVSLHASNQQVRQSLIPSAKKYPIKALLAECREYVEITGRRVTFEYIVLSGVNDRPHHAVELAGLLKGFQSHVNLIPYNPIDEVDYQRPTRKRLRNFVRELERNRVAVSIRQSRGLDKNAACGQLRASALKST
ncbi:MAG: 23S rRNA (adenine(2503)-C(2))-methyltransferase RlmN [Cyanobacteria bacterium P01_F01_bin.150]